MTAYSARMTRPRTARHRVAVALLVPLFVLFLLTLAVSWWLLIPALILGAIAQHAWGPVKAKPKRRRRRIRLTPMLFWRL